MKAEKYFKTLILREREHTAIETKAAAKKGLMIVSEMRVKL
jgi:hypothetical protein